MTTLEQLALALGHSGPHKFRRVRRWRLNPAWPFGDGPYSPVEVHKWSLGLQEDRSSATSEHSAADTEAKRRLVQERTKLIALRAQKEAGELISREEVAAGWVARAAALKSALLPIPRELGPRLVGMNAVQIEDAVEEAIRAALEVYCGDDA